MDSTLRFFDDLSACVRVRVGLPARRCSSSAPNKAPPPPMLNRGRNSEVLENHCCSFAVSVRAPAVLPALHSLPPFVCCRPRHHLSSRLQPWGFDRRREARGLERLHLFRSHRQRRLAIGRGGVLDGPGTLFAEASFARDYMPRRSDQNVVFAAITGMMPRAIWDDRSEQALSQFSRLRKTTHVARAHRLCGAPERLTRYCQ